MSTSKMVISVVALALAAVLLYFSLRGIEWRDVWKLISGAKPGSPASARPATLLKAEGAHVLSVSRASRSEPRPSPRRGHRPWVPDRAIVRVVPFATPGQADAPGNAAADDEPRFNGNPEE
jgi:hypothetical protein